MFSVVKLWNCIDVELCNINTYAKIRHGVLCSWLVVCTIITINSCLQEPKGVVYKINSFGGHMIITMHTGVLEPP